MDKVYQAVYAGHPVRYAFLEPGTRQYFKFWLKPVESETYDLRATPELVALTQKHMPEANPQYAEYKAVIGLTSEFLQRYGCCLFHAVAFLWRDRAWLLTAPSGTGKTTQFMNWRQLYPGEITMICGDMPVLELREDNDVWVHASNWNGKEGVGSFCSAPLGGLILLEQGKENRIEPMTALEAIPPLFGQFVSDYENEEQIRAVCALMDGMLSRYPAWKYTNLGDYASTKQLRRTIAEKTGGADETL